MWRRRHLVGAIAGCGRVALPARPAIAGDVRTLDGPARGPHEDPRPDEGIDKAGHFADALAKRRFGDALHQFR